VVAAVRAGEPVVVTGCGTSEHGAMAIAEQIVEALRSMELSGRRWLVRSEQAFELALEPPSSGVVIGVSHEGGTAATNRALEAARAAGARAAIVTAAGNSPAAALADRGLVVATDEVDQSWCHTVAYLSAVVVGALIAARIADHVMRADEARSIVRRGFGDVSTIDRAAERLAGVERIVVVASGADRPAGRELVLKIEEGAALPAAYRDLETFLHGHLAGIDEHTALVAVLADRRGGAERAERGRQLLTAAQEVGADAFAITSTLAAAEIPADLTPAGRVVVPDAPELAAATAALLGTAVPFQLLTERLARVRGRNPDAIRRDEPRYLRAAEAAEG